MATDSLSSSTDIPDAGAGIRELATKFVTACASLRLTVVLFAFAIFLVLVGTLAQVEMDMWEVMDVYFRSVVAWVDLAILFPRSWFPSDQYAFARVLRDGIQVADGKALAYAFPIPGGFLLGALMGLNLLAAHMIRFRIQAKGSQLNLGLAVIGVGTLITYLVIASGHNQAGLQGEPPISWAGLWLIVQISLVVFAIGCSGALAFGTKLDLTQRLLLLAGVLLFGGLAVAAILNKPGDSAMRILWQLLQGGVAGLVLLVGCWLTFHRRAGVVLLHAGIALIMFSEFYVSQYASEARMTLREGETVNYVHDIRAVELAVVDPSDPKQNKVVAIPGSLLVPGETLTNDALPFDIYVKSYLKNASLVSLDEATQEVQDGNYADTGSGKRFIAKPARAATGTDGGQVDLAAVYVELREKGTEKGLGRYMLSQIAASNGFQEDAELDGKTYQMSLRFKREYKDYWISLQDVRKDDYLGTNTPRNYSSDVRVTQEAGSSVVGDFKIWMNNPLRYAGETFYQSDYHFDPSSQTEGTGLQVVSNTGWMMPYVGCMLVSVGMLAHFSLTLLRFVTRMLAAEADRRKEQAPATGLLGKIGPFVLPALLVLLFAGYTGSKLRPPTDVKANMRLHEFGKLPVVYQGRIKPLDTLARNMMRVVSNKETFKDSQDQKRPAIQWLLDVVSGSPDASKHRVFRIDNLEVLDALGLSRRKGFRYAEEEFSDKLREFETLVADAKAVEGEKRSFYQRKLLELDQRVRAVQMLRFAFTPIPFPKMPTEEEFKADREGAMRTMQEIGSRLQVVRSMQSMLERMEPPLVVPVGGEQAWLPFSSAWNAAYAAQFSENPGVGPAPATLLWDKMLRSYKKAETKVFNDSVAEYQKLLADDPPEQLAATKVAYMGVAIDKVPFEFAFNSSGVFSITLVMYVVGFVLVALALLLASMGLFRPLNRSVFWLLVFAFCVHSGALLARVIISGRPPITNLYSSAVFIGWSAVGFGLIIELIYRNAIGNIIATVIGFVSLLIAYALAADGDTFTVLQAVLDTQFWLATHVVCITLGYAVTFVAGLLGVVYLLCNASRFRGLGKSLTSMIYGTLCFAIFFSFVGTVLGGLWADDSWGRFWGWDPKENGALIIVLWNALILHARWGGMVRQHGLAVLAVLGNITTAWSWFGVNELGVGLHSYGFTEGVLRNLGLFVLSQLAVVAYGIIAYRMYTADRKQAVATT